LIETSIENELLQREGEEEKEKDVDLLDEMWENEEEEEEEELRENLLKEFIELSDEQEHELLNEEEEGEGEEVFMIICYFSTIVCVLID